LGIFFSQKLQAKCGIWGIFFQCVAVWEIMSQMVAFGSKSPGCVGKKRMMRCARWQNLFCADLEKIVLKNI
jgi:hypothetical protein